MHESVRVNVLCFLADLFSGLELRPVVRSVQLPGVKKAQVIEVPDPGTEKVLAIRIPDATRLIKSPGKKFVVLIANN